MPVIENCAGEKNRQNGSIGQHRHGKTFPENGRREKAVKRGHHPIGKGRFVESGFPVEGGDVPIALLQHFAWGLGIEGFITVPKRRVIQSDEKGKSEKKEKPVATNEVPSSRFQVPNSKLKITGFGL